MKCFIAIVVLAVVAASNASVIPLPIASAWGSQIIAAPLAPAISTTRIIGAPSIALHAAAIPAFPTIHQVVHPGLQAVHIAAIPASGSYIAANRGTVHTAPLPGHADSAVSLNLQPAPGTL